MSEGSLCLGETEVEAVCLVFCRQFVILVAKDRSVAGIVLYLAQYSFGLTILEHFADSRPSCWACLHPAVYEDSAYRLTLTVWCLLATSRDFLFESGYLCLYLFNSFSFFLILSFLIIFSVCFVFCLFKLRSKRWVACYEPLGLCAFPGSAKV